MYLSSSRLWTTIATMLHVANSPQYHIQQMMFCICPLKVRVCEPTLLLMDEIKKILPDLD